jgi:hypothetical protein
MTTPATAQTTVTNQDYGTYSLSGLQSTYGQETNATLTLGQSGQILGCLQVGCTGSGAP